MTAAAARAEGLRVDVVARERSLASLIAALGDYGALATPVDPAAALRA